MQTLRRSRLSLPTSLHDSHDPTGKNRRRRFRQLPFVRRLLFLEPLIQSFFENYGLKRMILLSLIFSCLMGIWVWSKYEVHVEIQTYDRGWVRQEILNVQGLDVDVSSCWNQPSKRYRKSLNQTRTISLHPSIPLSHGNDCYNFLRTLPSNPSPHQVLPHTTTYHTYWRSDLLPFGPRQLISLRSILLTQTQSNVVLWTNGRPSTLLNYEPLENLIKRYGNRIVIRTADIPALSSSTVLKDSQLLKGISDGKAWVDGDLIRLLVLWNFGGVWVDMDMVLTKDLRPLLEQEWVEEWDCYRKPYQVLNGALMHFHAASPYLCSMFQLMLASSPPRPSSTDWGSTLYHRTYRLLLSHHITPPSVLPWCAADARNCRLDNRLPEIFEKDEKMSESRREELEWRVESVYGIHLHNQWKKVWPKDGWFQRFVIDKLNLEK